MIAEFAGAAALAVWVYLLAARGGFWLEFLHTPPPPPPSTRAPSIVAVIPARNEAPSVGLAIGSLCRQNYAGPFHIVLVDDGSDDGTADAARDAAPAGLLTVVKAPPLPAGWSGKLWAVAEGVRCAAAHSPDLLLLTDADIVHPPDALTGLAARAESGYGLVSYMATLECRTLAERALVPAFVFFFFMLYPPAWVRGNAHGISGAAGGCMLIRRSVLESIGGIQAIRGALIDDCALAQAVQRQGSRVWLSLNAATRSIRPYQSFGEMGRMISRTAFTQLRHSGWLLLGTALALTVTYIVPPVLSIAGSTRAAGLGSLAWLLMCCAYLPALRFYRRSPLWAPFLPVVALFYLCATLHSALAWWRGAGGMWKGRVQDAEPRP
jgi:hopene-associated glycosyltransferase HpnB